MGCGKWRSWLSRAQRLEKDIDQHSRLSALHRTVRCRAFPFCSTQVGPFLMALMTLCLVAGSILTTNCLVAIERSGQRTLGFTSQFSMI